MYDAYADHEVDNDQHFFMLAKPYHSSEMTLGFFDCSYIYDYTRQRQICDMLKRNLMKYMERRSTSVQRFFDRRKCYEEGDMGKYNKMIIYR